MPLAQLDGRSTLVARVGRVRANARRRCICEPVERRILLSNVPDGFTDSTIATDLDSPTAMEVAPDGRIFIAGQKGNIFIVDGADVVNAMTIPNVDSSEERGFLGITLDPTFESNGYVYVYYTRIGGTGSSGKHNRLARYTFNGNSPVGAETVLLDLPDINDAIFHMGGALHFGPDGKLYVAVGDHLIQEASQELTNLFGKILRVNSNGSIPTDNPFYTQTTGLNRAIWAYGLRNPFTFNFQPGTGRIFINDVGGSNWEEINVGAAGANYGWPLSEGPDNTAGFTGPIYWYHHFEGCAVTGGVFYNPQTSNFPQQYVGQYFFADLCHGWIKRINPVSHEVTPFSTDAEFPVDLDLAPDGSLLYLQRGFGTATGSVGRITAEELGAPTISTHPRSQTVIQSASASFSVQAIGAGTLQYQWQRNNNDIAGATSPTYTIQNAQGSNAGSYRVRVSNNLGTVTSNTATLSVVPGNAPNPFIDTPVAGTKFRGGQTFSFSGHATDPEDGTLAAGRFTWQVDYHTGTVVRPFVNATSGITSGSFTIPTETPYKLANVFYRVRLTVTDSTGISSTVTRDLQPITSTIAVRSNIAGAGFFLDGETRTMPFNAVAVAGIRRFLESPATQTFGGVNYLFDGWSNGGERSHQFSTATSDTTYTARYRVAPNSATKGLAMSIHNNRDRTGTLITKNVSALDFDWGSGSPDPLIHPDTFFIRFRGKVQPEFTETYTFYTRADDAVRLFVNGQLLIDAWRDSDGSELSASIALEAGNKYDLRFDYYESAGAAFAHLLWSSPSTPKQIIPRAKLFTSIMPQMFLPTADSFVQGGSAAATNFGSRDSLVIKSAANESLRREAYLKFDISGLNLATMGTAKLRMFGRLVGEQDINVMTALYHGPSAKWSEAGLTWTNKPTSARKAIATAVVSNSHNQWWEFDITSFLRKEREAGRNIVTFVLKNLTDTQVYTLLYSRQSATGPLIIASV